MHRNAVRDALESADWVSAQCVLPDGRLASGADNHTAGRDHNEIDVPLVGLTALPAPARPWQPDRDSLRGRFVPKRPAPN